MSAEFEEENNSKQTEVYRELGQGIKVLYEGRHPEIDIIAIPGLGTNPQECWTWTASGKNSSRHGNAPDTSDDAGAASDTLPIDRNSRKQFNWIRDKAGLAALYPRSRILLYDYASAWKGQRKVRARMKDICTWLLVDLRERRKEGSEVTRPLIFIGHSMGGVVVAKTLCIARARKEFESIVTCTMGCLFFGAPFRGSNMAKIALLYSSIFGNEAYESLLAFLKTEKNDTLEEVTDDFLELSKKLEPHIDLVCCYEQVPTNVAYSDRAAQKMGALLEHKYLRAGAKKLMDVGLSTMGSGTHFVEMESAVLKGSTSIGMTASHSDLIKFESPQSERFALIKAHLSNMVQAAKMNVRKRIAFLGHNLLSHKFVNQIRESLEVVDMRLKYRSKVKQRTSPSWLLSVPIYKTWLDPPDVGHAYLWLKGGPGLGKTNACLTAVETLDNANADDDANGVTSAGETFLAYFFCEWSAGYSTAEDLLKNLIIQFINQNESLAQHAKWFVSSNRSRGLEYSDSADEPGAISTKATITVDNLWRCLQDILEDPIVTSAHLILSNLHCLESGESTGTLLARLEEMIVEAQKFPQGTQRVKWLLTSRGDVHISSHLKRANIGIVDLQNDNEYGNQVKTARQNYAKNAISQLRAAKHYSTDLAWYLRSSIQSQSEDEKWIDVLIILLKAMPDGHSNLAIRKWMRGVGHYNINKLVDLAWNTVLQKNEDVRLELEELIQTLTVTFEDPTIAELSVLTKVEISRLENLVRKCAPLLCIGEWPDEKDRSSQQDRHHGFLALRCFEYINTSYDSSSGFRQAGLQRSESKMQSYVAVTRSDDGKVLEIAQDPRSDESSSATATGHSNLQPLYPVRHLFNHLAKAQPDVVLELCDIDPHFWCQESGPPIEWLKDFQSLTVDLKGLDPGGMSTVHVAAGVGATEVLAALVERTHGEALLWESSEGMTPLHLAAYKNRRDAVDTLIRAGANIEAGREKNGTALHLAASQGNCSVMSLLIERGADVNALGEAIGPVINAAIQSGTMEAIRLVMDEDVRFDLDYTKIQAPLSLSAGNPDTTLFKEILDTGKDKWLQNAKLIDQALISAARRGRLENLKILLNFEHDYTHTTIETAIISAAQERKWSCANEISEHALKTMVTASSHLKLDDVFTIAISDREEHLEVLGKLWALSGKNVSEEVVNYSLYQAIVMKKEATAMWLQTVCNASPSASGERPPSINAEYTIVSDMFGNSLNAAAWVGNLRLVTSLLERGAAINSMNDYSLQLAAKEGHTEVLEILISKGATLDRIVADNSELGFTSGTALQAACENNRAPVVRALLYHGCNANLAARDRVNPLTAVTQKGNLAILRLLLEYPDIDVNVVGGQSLSTPLINAATTMSAEAVELLLQKGADINANNADGDTALIMAASKGDQMCVDLLCRRGADVTYRSPRRGMAIQVAAEAAYPVCARVLADRMGHSIEVYREQVKIDPSKEALEATRLELQQRINQIEELTAKLSEATDSLEVAQGDIEIHKLANRELVDERTLSGQTYESIGQQLKATQAERSELFKQVDGWKGQFTMAKETNMKLSGLLETERRKNEELRNRGTWDALQKEREAALEAVENEKIISSQALQVEEEKRFSLMKQIESLEQQSSAMQAKLISVTEAERLTSQDLTQAIKRADEAQAEAKQWEDQYNKLSAVIDQTKALVGSSTTSPPRSSMGSPIPPSMSAIDETLEALLSENADQGFALVGEGRVIERRPVGSPPLASRQSQSNGIHSSPGIEQAHFNAAMTSSPEIGGFRTAHGQHRSNGSLGGYRNGGVMKRTTSDSLYDLSEHGASDDESSFHSGEHAERTFQGTSASKSTGTDGSYHSSGNENRNSG